MYTIGSVGSFAASNYCRVSEHFSLIPVYKTQIAAVLFILSHSVANPHARPFKWCLCKNFSPVFFLTFGLFHVTFDCLVLSPLLLFLSTLSLRCARKIGSISQNSRTTVLNHLSINGCDRIHGVLI